MCVPRLHDPVQPDLAESACQVCHADFNSVILHVCGLLVGQLHRGRLQWAADPLFTSGQIRCTLSFC